MKLKMKITENESVENLTLDEFKRALDSLSNIKRVFEEFEEIVNMID